MSQYTETRSEVARLLAQIQAEYHSGMRGLSGLASGNARHDFIAARMERIGQFHNELCDLVGPHDAIALVVHTLDDEKETGNEGTEEAAETGDNC
jgi:hypothetical protein